MEFVVKIKDINALNAVDVAAMYTRLSNPGRNMRTELERRYVTPAPGPHETIMLATVWCNDEFVAWVGTRAVTAKFKGEAVAAQSIECFTAVEHRRKGLAQFGLLALVAGGYINRETPVTVYRASVIPLATKVGCKTVIYCDP